LDFLDDTKVDHVLLERITPNGNATRNTSIMPSNLELDAWFVKLWNASNQRKAYTRYMNMFFNSILTTHIYHTASGCRSRSCEQKIFTLNATGTIGGCPNGAVDTTFGHITDDIRTLLASRGRQHNIACEMTRNNLCYTCDVYDICNGDCHQLQWEGDICASPKSLMRQIKTTDMGFLQEVIGQFKGSE
jgi:radical SAM protein with 4Fe4S-binding SPASM domain